MTTIIIIWWLSQTSAVFNSRLIRSLKSPILLLGLWSLEAMSLKVVHKSSFPLLSTLWCQLANILWDSYTYSSSDWNFFLYLFSFICHCLCHPTLLSSLDQASTSQIRMISFLIDQLVIHNVRGLYYSICMIYSNFDVFKMSAI